MRNEPGEALDTEKQKHAWLSCATCARAVTACAGCERDDCKNPLCSLCLYVLLGQSQSHPHMHGG